MGLAELEVAAPGTVVDGEDVPAALGEAAAEGQPDAVVTAEFVQQDRDALPLADLHGEGLAPPLPLDDDLPVAVLVTVRQTWCQSQRQICGRPPAGLECGSGCSPPVR